MIVTQKDILLKIEQLERKDLSHDHNIMQIFKVLKQLIGPASKPRQAIGFKTDNEN